MYVRACTQSGNGVVRVERQRRSSGIDYCSRVVSYERKEQSKTVDRYYRKWIKRKLRGVPQVLRAGARAYVRWCCGLCQTE